MKITVELPDPTTAPETELESATEKAVTPAPSQPKDVPSAKHVASGTAESEAEATAPAPKPKAEKKQPPPSAPEVRSAPRPVAKMPQKPSEEKPSQPSAVSTPNPLHSFDVQGGTNDISDPDANNPNVYRFIAPKGEA